jgi:phosphate-selective porin OprO/OprP
MPTPRPAALALPSPLNCGIPPLSTLFLLSRGRTVSLGSQGMARHVALNLVALLVLAGGWRADTARGDELPPPAVTADRPSPLVQTFLAPSSRAPVRFGEEQSLKDLSPGAPKEKDEKKTAADDRDGSQARFNLKEGLVGQTADGAFRYHVGGRVDWDSGWYNVPTAIQNSLFSTAEGKNPAALEDGTDLRRLRLGVDGTVWDMVDFKVEVDLSRASDFTGQQSKPETNIFITDAWMALRDLPVVGTLKAGHQKEYLTFANGTSARFIPFMERPYIFDAFENPFSWDDGVTVSRTFCDQSVSFWSGVFWNNTRSQAFNVGGHYAASGRLTWMPVYSEEEQRWLCLGASGSVRSFHTNDPNSIGVRPLVRTGQSFDVPNLIVTDHILSRDVLSIFGLGAHSGWGPLTVGGEFLCWNLTNTFSGSLPNDNGTLPKGAVSLGDLFLSGYYVEALYFLTPGDHQPVNRTTPGYDRVRPVNNFEVHKSADGPECRGWGAWEVGLRYDHVSLNSGGLRAGVLDSVTVGLNWYLNPNTRLMANYVYTFRSQDSAAPSGGFDAFGVRVHFDF